MKRAGREKPSTLTRSSSARQVVVNNLGWLITSLLLAMVVWYAASSADNPVDQRRLSSLYTINVKTDPGMMIIEQSQKNAQVTLRALQRTFDEISTDDINITADLTKHEPGIYDVDLNAELNNHRGRIVDIQPRQIKIEIAKRDEKLLKVTVVVSSSPPVGFFVNATTSSEVEAKVSGPEAKVKRVTAIQAIVDAQNQRVPFKAPVRLIAVDADNHAVGGVDLSPSQVTIDVDVQERTDGVELQVNPTYSGQPASGYLLVNTVYEPRSVFVRGDRTTLNTMQGIVSTEPIDLTQKAENFTQKVKLVLPTGVYLPDPTDITVTIEIRPDLISRTFDNIPVQAQGLDPADFNITINPPRVRVTITGPRSVVNALTENDISIFAPVRGFAAGPAREVTLQPSVTKAGIEVQNITLSATSAQVTITARNPTATPTAAGGQ